MLFVRRPPLGILCSQKTSVCLSLAIWLLIQTSWGDEPEDAWCHNRSWILFDILQKIGVFYVEKSKYEQSTKKQHDLGISYIGIMWTIVKQQDRGHHVHATNVWLGWKYIVIIRFFCRYGKTFIYLFLQVVCI